MKKFLVCSLSVLLVFVAMGCATGSSLTLGPATASSRAEAHHWSGFDFNRNSEDHCFETTLGFVSFDLCGNLHECNGVDADAYIDWDQDSETESAE